MHRLRTKCNLVYKIENRKTVYIYTIIMVITILSGFLFLITGKGQQDQTGLVDFMEISEDMWTEVEWKDEAPVAHDFFQDPNQKYLHHSFTDDAALAVANYANRSKLEESEWELRRLCDRGDLDKIAAFVKSDKGRELYLYANDDIDRIQYLLAADVKEGEGLTYTLGNGRCSYDSDLEWTTYVTLPNKDRENGLYTFTWDEEAWIFDSVYLKPKSREIYTQNIIG